MSKEKRMILKREVPDKLTINGWTNKTEEFEVIVLSIVGKYAMVRRPACMPFVELESNLYEKKI